jgi:hypothetical protein
MEENKMRKIFTAMLVVFMAVGSAYAVDMSTTGKYKIRGNYEENVSSVNSGDRGPYMFYDHELVLEPTLTISDATKIDMQLEFNDANWSASNEGHDSKKLDGNQAGDNIVIEYLYGSHTFSTGTQFQGGLMAVGEWSHAFGNTETPGWRARINQPVGGGTLIAMLQKVVEAQEEGYAYAPVEGEDSESKDADAYLLGWAGKAGDIDIQPLIAYIQNGATNEVADNSDTDNTMLLVLGFGGQAGMVGWEAEFDYSSTALDGTNATRDAAGLADLDDQTAWGAYAGVNFDLGTVTPGLKIAYGSYSEDDGTFAYGEDYDAGGMMIFGEDVGFGPTMAKDDGNVAGATTVTVYADFDVSDALSFFGGLAYLMSNSSDDGPWKDASAYEIDVKGTYKLSDNVSYHVDCGYASIDWDSDPSDATVTDDPDGITKIQHYLEIKF